MKAIILAAGSNGKLNTELGDKPKSMLEISDTNLLSVQLDSLYKAGIENVAVVRGYGKEYIDIPGVTYYDNNDYDNTGVLYSLYCAREELDDEVLIVYGDIAFTEEVISKFNETKADFNVGVIVDYQTVLGENVDLSQKEMVIFDNDNNVCDIGKGISLGADNNAFFSGIIKCSRRGCEILKRHFARVQQLTIETRFLNADSFRKIWLTDFLNELCFLGVDMQCTLLKSGWYELDRFADYERLCKDEKFMSKILNVKTDWTSRAETYNSLQWVNKSSTLDCMVDEIIKEPKRVLDLGTGTGKVLEKIISRYPKAEGYGVDISAAMMNKIEEKGFHLEVGRIEDLSMFEDNCFDVVTARMVLHHSDNLKVAFSEVMRVLKPQGQFIVCEGTPPNKECVKFYRDMFKYKETRNTFLLDDLMNYYSQAGFVQVKGQFVVMDHVSLNNWLDNAGVPYRNIDLIRRLHYQAEEKVKVAYNMEETSNDLFMTWKFAVVSGTK